MWILKKISPSAPLTRKVDGDADAASAVAIRNEAKWHQRWHACALIGLAMVASLPSSAWAQQTGWMDEGGQTITDETLPWSINALPYIADPTYNSGRISPDAFAGSFSNDHYGRKIVHLDDGSVIVAGVVPPISGGSNPVNLGLVRYLPNGVRTAWSSPGIYGHFGNQYVVYPNVNTSATTDGNVIDVRDMKVIGSRLFVLVNHRWGPNDLDANVLVFNLSGQFLSSTGVSQSLNNEVAGGIVVYSNLQFPETISIAYAGYVDEAGVSRPEFRHGTVNADGTIAFAAIVRPNPANYCPADRGCMLTSISGGRMPSGVTRFYVAGTRYNTGAADTDYLVMALNSSGTPVTSFAEFGVTTVPFNRGGALSDSVNKVISRFGFVGGSDTIYLVGDVSQACKTGVGVAKLTGAGDLDVTFGEPQALGGRSGKRVIGGSTSTNPLFCSSFAAATYSYDAVIEGAKLGIASTTFSPRIDVACLPGQPCAEINLDGSIIVLDSVSGDTDSFSSYPYTDVTGGARTRHSSFIGIAGTGDGRFTVAGAARYFEATVGGPVGKNQYASLRVKPLDDVIFRNGFDSN